MHAFRGKYKLIAIPQADVILYILLWKSFPELILISSNCFDAKVLNSDWSGFFFCHLNNECNASMFTNFFSSIDLSKISIRNFRCIKKKKEIFFNKKSGYFTFWAFLTKILSIYFLFCRNKNKRFICLSHIKYGSLFCYFAFCCCLFRSWIFVC